MIGNETGHLLKFVDLRRKWINISETLHMLRRDIAASMLKILCQKINPIKSYSKTKMTVFVLSLWEKYRWGLTSFGQFILFYRKLSVAATCAYLAGVHINIAVMIYQFHQSVFQLYRDEDDYEIWSNDVLIRFACIGFKPMTMWW